MELLRHTMDLHHTVVQTTFPAGEHTVLKEVITDTSYARPGSPAPERRVSFRLHLDVPTMRNMPAGQLLRKTKSYPSLSALCQAFGIDPERAAMGTACGNEPVAHGPQPEATHRHAIRSEKGQFTQRQRTHA